VKVVEELADDKKVLSWQWTLVRLKIPNCMYYEWWWNPKNYLLGWEM